MLPWQDIVAIALVGLCAGYLAWQGWRFIVRRKAGGCATGSCTSCTTAQSDSNKPIVTIEELQKGMKRD